MKSTKILFVIVCLICSKVQAQSLLDSISFQDFKKMNFKEMKQTFQHDSGAIKIIKTTQNWRTARYAAIPLVFTPVGAYAVVGGIGISILNTKKKLYQHLKVYNAKKLGVIPEFIPKYSTPIIQKTDSLPLFDLSLAQFKKLSKKQQDSMFVHNDSTQYIFDYTYDYQTKKYVLSGITIGCVAATGIFYYYFDKNLNTKTTKLSIIVPIFFFGALTLVSGTVGLYSAAMSGYALSRGSQSTLYNNLKNYYTNHQVNGTLAKYIKNRKKQFYN